LLIDEDDEARPLLKENLKRYGYRVMLALDEEDALERVGGRLTQADLLLIDLIDKPAQEVLGVGRRIRRHAKYDGRTPLVVLAESYGADVEGTDVNVGDNDWITYLEDHNQLKNLLGRLTLKNESSA
jgi:CheY-like chemotaxis protein